MEPATHLEVLPVKKMILLALASVLVTSAMVPVTVGAQTCSCPWQVVQGDNTGLGVDCATVERNNRNNLNSYAYWMCGNRTPCTTVYTHLSCTTDAQGYTTESGLLNYKCC